MPARFVEASKLIEEDNPSFDNVAFLSCGGGVATVTANTFTLLRPET